jgi:uncharacterized protein (DUF2141 family)
MKITYLFTLRFITFLFIIPMGTTAQNTLTIDIKGLRNDQGHVLLQLFDESEKSIREIKQPIENKECTILLTDLGLGRYGFKYFHDENDNQNLDTNWVGIPKEGFGFSNNAKATFGPPSFTKWVFELSGNKEIICSPQYF